MRSWSCFRKDSNSERGEERVWISFRKQVDSMKKTALWIGHTHVFRSDEGRYQGYEVIIRTVRKINQSAPSERVGPVFDLPHGTGCE